MLLLTCVGCSRQLFFVDFFIYFQFPPGRYLEMARRSSDVVWKRGLLTKGNGLCHGVAGNGYAFLALRKANGDDGRHLHRARSFAGAFLSFRGDAGMREGEEGCILMTTHATVVDHGPRTPATSRRERCAGFLPTQVSCFTRSCYISSHPSRVTLL